jgi:hypothetical protein
MVGPIRYVSLFLTFLDDGNGVSFRNGTIEVKYVCKLYNTILSQIFALDLYRLDTGM